MVDIPDQKLAKLIVQGLNMALGNQANGETSYSDSFDGFIANDGFVFVPRMPAAYRVNQELNKAVYEVVSVMAYPYKTVAPLKTQPNIISIKTEDFHTRRGLFYPWKDGISQRLYIKELDEYARNHNDGVISIMPNYKVDYINKINHVVLSGVSGSGKSYFLNYLLEMISTFTSKDNLIIIDPKIDQPARWGRNHGYTVLIPHAGQSQSDYVSKINEKLSGVLKHIFKRQRQLYDDPTLKFKPITICIDELLALTEGIATAIRNSFFSLLSQIALLGRATQVKLILAAQRFQNSGAGSLPIVVREQANFKVLLGAVNSKTTSVLFPDIDASGIIVPDVIGSGIVQLNQGIVTPLLTPSYGG